MRRLQSLHRNNKFIMIRAQKLVGVFTWAHRSRCVVRWDSNSSHDPSATPRIPRARTRWKKAAAAGEQCFGNKTPERWIRRKYRHVWKQLRSCVGKRGFELGFVCGECVCFAEIYATESPGSAQTGDAQRPSIIVSVAWAVMRVFSRGS